MIWSIKDRRCVENFKDYVLNMIPESFLARKNKEISLDDIEQLFAKAIRHHQAKQFDDARTCYEKLLTIAPDHVDARTNYAQLLKLQGHEQQALQEFEAAASNAEAKAPLFLNWGNMLLLKEEYSKAADIFRDGIQRDGSLANLHLGLGVALYHQQKIEEALVHFRQAVKKIQHCGVGGKELRVA